MPINNNPYSSVNSPYGYSQPMPTSGQPLTAVPSAAQAVQAPYMGGLILNFVHNKSEANAWPVSPGTSAWFIDMDSSRIYIKTVDTSGMPMPLRTFRYEEEAQQNVEQKPVAKPENQNSFVTKEEFEAFRQELLYGRPDKRNSIKQRGGNGNEPSV